MSSAQTWDVGGSDPFGSNYGEPTARRGDLPFSVAKFAAFCADPDGAPLSADEMASARRLCRELQGDFDAW